MTTTKELIAKFRNIAFFGKTCLNLTRIKLGRSKEADGGKQTLTCRS
jgi:hypothetical protein